MALDNTHFKSRVSCPRSRGVTARMTALSGALCILSVGLAPSCSHDWDSYDPRAISAGSAGDGEACRPRIAEPCYEGVSGTENIGICKPGLRACNELGTGFGACFGQVTPSVEECSTLQDDDCNG